MSDLTVKSPSYVDSRFAPLSPEAPDEFIAQKTYPQFSNAERESRHSAVRRSMDERNIGCLIVMGCSSRRGEGMGNMRYISGFGSKDSTCCYLLFPLEGKPALFLERKIKPSARATSWVSDMRPFSTETAGEKLAMEITQRKLQNSKIGLVGVNESLRMPYNIYQSLTERLPDTEFVDVTNLLNELRMVKSPEEVKFIKKASEICARGYFEELAVLRPGLSEFQLQASILKAMFDAGCEEPAMVLINSCSRTGPLLAIVDSYSSGRIIQEGDVIFTEITGKYAGYCAQSLHTICLGSIPPKLAEMSGFANDQYKAVLNSMKPGKTWNEVADVGAKMLGQKGYTRSSQFFHSLGYGAPDPDPRPRDNIKLQNGMVFSIETNPITPDGQWGVLLGCTVLITDSEPEVLTRGPMRIESL